MRQDVSETLEVSRLELLRRASTYGDLQAWAAFQQSLEETVLTWFHDHPGREAACRVQSERHFVALAFERLRQAVVQGQVACETLSEVLVYLRASLNGAILETLRVSSRPGAVSSPWPDVEDRPDRSEVWDRLQARLSNQREQSTGLPAVSLWAGTRRDCAVLSTGMERCPRGRSSAAHQQPLRLFDPPAIFAILGC